MAEFNTKKVMLIGLKGEPGSGAEYSAGNGITIDSQSKIAVKPKSNSGIAVDSNGVSVDFTKAQKKLTAGTNITITDEGVISASGGGGGSYTAGEGIKINNGVISADVEPLNPLIINPDDKLAVQFDGVTLQQNDNGELEVNKNAMQEKLVAGSGISIAADGKTISATGGGSSLTAKTPIAIVNDEIQLKYNLGLAKDASGVLNVDFSDVQHKLTAGSGISISGNTISATGGGSYSAGDGINIDSNNKISLYVNSEQFEFSDGELNFIGGGTKKYLHNIMIFKASGQQYTMAISFQIVSTSQTAAGGFSALRALIYNAGYTSSSKFAPCSGLYDNTSPVKRGITVFAGTSNITVACIKDVGTQSAENITSSSGIYVSDFVVEI